MSLCDKSNTSEPGVTANSVGNTVVIQPVVVLKIGGFKFRALLDSGASHSYISSTAIDLIKVRPKSTGLREIAMLTGIATRTKPVFDVVISSVASDFKLDVDITKVNKKELLVLENPGYKHLIEANLHLKGVRMDDEDTKQMLPVHITLGANDFAKIRTGERLRVGRRGDPVAEFTRFGWTIMSPGSLYVDDLLSGGPTIEKAKQLKRETTEIFADAKFELHKWHSNRKELQTACEDYEPPFAKEQLENTPAKGECKLVSVGWDKFEDTLYVCFPATPAEQTRHDSKPLRDLLNSSELEEICELLDAPVCGKLPYEAISRWYGASHTRIKPRFQEGKSEAVIAWLVAEKPELTVGEFATVVKDKARRTDAADKLKAFDAKATIELTSEKYPDYSSGFLKKTHSSMGCDRILTTTLFLAAMLQAHTGSCSICKYGEITYRSNQAGQKDKCGPCIDCPDGMEPSIACGSVAEYGTLLDCVACREGTYSDTYGKEQCKPCALCSAGRTVTRNCSTTLNSDCGSCKHGYYEKEVVEGLIYDCEPCSDCCWDNKDEFEEQCKAQGLPRHQRCKLRNADRDI
ncbi:Tumor necrosis factor receptor superfamily member 19 [Stylophora pistillata]|uniref:Tumor necrosis factor receptor superfamily member 19 n=1 Tax=Stylophora pistillata TaxID=50429 RepID=A0A2B4RQV6_STYPI|nr:Tumor necrosis factor receptor superfamily member 19 [Stylophora pistillata]